MRTEILERASLATSDEDIPCRFCGRPASFIDRYLSPFVEDRSIFHQGMNIYYCRREEIGFAYPVPTADNLSRYYKEIYRDSRRMYPEDSHKQYTVVKSTPLARSQFMYLSQFIDFDAIQTVIDMGCGHGMLLSQIRARNPRIRLIGIELDPAVRPFLEKIGAEFIHASATEQIDAVCDSVGNDTLLISSHALHYQDDIEFLHGIIRTIKVRRKNNVCLFIEVPNDTINDPAYMRNRVYDVPKLLFFTAAAFNKGIFDFEIINVATNGWSLDQEILFRSNRLRRYLQDKGRFRMRAICRGIAKYFLPIRVRMLLKAMLTGARTSSSEIFYYSYGGPRRAIRVLGRIG